jgi:hypothetical protein
VRRMFLLGLVSAAALSIVALTRGNMPPAEVAPTRVPAPPERPFESAEPVGLEAPLRNVFEYGPLPEARVEPRDRPEPRLAQPPEGIADATEPVRFVGVVARGERACAALVIEGEVVLLAPGESSAGYTLLAVDADEGAHLRTPAGAEMRANAEP